MPRVLHITARADLGGGPEVLWRLLGCGDPADLFVACPEDVPFAGRYRSMLGSDRVLIIPHRGFTPRSLERLRRVVLENHISLLHSHGFGAGIYGRLLSLLTSRPCVHTYHGFLLAGSSGVTTAVKYLIEACLSMQTGVAVAVSSSERDTILAKLPWMAGRLRVVPNGVSSPTSMESPRSTEGPLQVLTVARLVPQKAPLAIIEIVNALARLGVIEKFRFTLAGDGPLMPELTRAIASSRMGNYITLAGPTDSPRSFFQRADVYLSTSLDEGLPLSVLDAMACGVAGVVTRIRGHIDLISDGVTGLLFNPGDPDAAARHLIRLADDPGMRGVFAQNARATAVTGYSLEQMWNGYQGCYADALQRNRAVMPLPAPVDPS